MVTIILTVTATVILIASQSPKRKVKPPNQTMSNAVIMIIIMKLKPKTMGILG